MGEWFVRFALDDLPPDIPSNLFDLEHNSIYMIRSLDQEMALLSEDKINAFSLNMLYSPMKTMMFNTFSWKIQYCQMKTKNFNTFSLKVLYYPMKTMNFENCIYFGFRPFRE